MAPSVIIRPPLCQSLDNSHKTPPPDNQFNDMLISRSDFPPGFKFGVATSAYQVEGAALADGRGMSIWDSFSHIPGNIYDASNGDVACDQYHKYKSDIQLMVDLGVDTYRFSLSWSRILPAGAGKINQEGVSYYNKLINDLLQNGIEPYVTLYHWDMPQALENDPDVKGWRTRAIVQYFAYYAETCFGLFGDRVKNWTTLNETQSFAYEGYGNGTQAPGRCSAICGAVKNFYVGDSSTEPYLCTHHALLSHAAAVKIYKSKYQAEQRGRIGITVNSRWYEPYTDTKEDAGAAQRCIEFELGWLLDPILLGDYPKSMKAGAGSRLPVFSEEERVDLVGSLDFVGYNYYTAYYAKNTPPVEPAKRWYSTDRLAVQEYAGVDGQWIGEPYGPVALRWIYNCPWALPKMLQWMEDRYGKEQFQRTPILITENGTMDMEIGIPIDEALNDSWRVRYMRDTLVHLAAALRKNKYNVEGYFAWSLLDNFEWHSGLACRFGLHYVDYTDKELKRYPKTSALWYRSLILQQHEEEPCSKPADTISTAYKTRIKSNRSCSLMTGSLILLDQTFASIIRLLTLLTHKEPDPRLTYTTPLLKSKGKPPPK